MTRIGAVCGAALVAGCSGEGKGSDTGTPPHGHEMAPFSLAFAAVNGGAPMTGLGPEGRHTVGLSDLRFYVSDLKLLDADGAEVEAALATDEFQYAGEAGWVGMIDLTSNSDGDCEATAISFSEGTARPHAALTGEAYVEDVAAISFSVGVPQALMKEIIGANTPEAAPSPLNEMYWSWATGYRHFVFNATVNDGVDAGEGYLHVGSTDCSAEGELALEGRDQCGFLNTPQVVLDTFDLATDTVTVDLGAALAGLELVAPIHDPETYEVIGEQPGFSCHSSPMQPDCAPIFANFGVDIGSGTADAAANAVFGRG